jgi:hypothetical protein
VAEASSSSFALTSVSAEETATPSTYVVTRRAELSRVTATVRHPSAGSGPYPETLASAPPPPVVTAVRSRPSLSYGVVKRYFVLSVPRSKTRCQEDVSPLHFTRADTVRSAASPSTSRGRRTYAPFEVGAPPGRASALPPSAPATERAVSPFTRLAVRPLPELSVILPEARSSWSKV